MIVLPRRSVTRFFIPLIDVLTLLFCIFLLMPLVKKTGDGDSVSTEPLTPATDLNALSPEELARRLDETRRALEQLRNERVEILQQRLDVKVLEIDGANGKLYYRDPDRVEIASEVDAHRLIARQKKDAGGKELYYLFLFPRQVSGYPEEGQMRQYERWFRDVAHGIDNPRAGR